MLPLEHSDRIQIAFDDHRLVANAGLLLPVTLAQHLGPGVHGGRMFVNNTGLKNLNSDTEPPPPHTGRCPRSSSPADKAICPPGRAPTG